MKILERDEIVRRLTPARCIGIMREVLAQLEQGRAVQYLRTVTPLPGGGIMGYMPAALEGMFGAKLITVFHHNSSRGLPSHQGSVLVFDEQDGSLMGIMDGHAITEIRTGAASAVATDLLARPEADTLALLGAGAQARSHCWPSGRCGRCARCGCGTGTPSGRKPLPGKWGSAPAWRSSPAPLPGKRQRGRTSSAP